jgi:hypothetical protein
MVKNLLACYINLEHRPMLLSCVMVFDALKFVPFFLIFICMHKFLLFFFSLINHFFFNFRIPISYWTLLLHWKMNKLVLSVLIFLEMGKFIMIQNKTICTEYSVFFYVQSKCLWYCLWKVIIQQNDRLRPTHLCSVCSFEWYTGLKYKQRLFF